MAQFLVVSLPFEAAGGLSHEDEREKTYRTLRHVTETQQDLCVNYRLAVPDLRVGTLDALLALSDDLSKSVALAEQATAKVTRQIAELSGSNDEVQYTHLQVDGVPVERYLTAFQWDEAKHPVRRPLKETVENIQAGIVTTEENLKVRMGEYNAIKSSLAAIARKGQGSLAVRDLRGIVPQEKLLDSENLVTLLVVVPRYSQKEWLAKYHSLAQYVVPRSSELIQEDSDSALYTVVLFKRVCDAFKHAAQEQGFQVREYVPPAEGEVALDAQQSELERAFETKKAELLAWSYTAYGEAFSSWVHLVTVRVFVESILRYGLPPSFVAAVMKPHARTAANPKQLRSLLASNFGRSQVHWKDEDDPAPGTEEAHPYVSFSMNLQ
mmetsp:Transcript_782/g.1665  ORF Transcript_782/g.1665 Transcript_782/m.1665 type:complete len:381 (-) Transcript_782:379-1521(-)|eukprot:CAMPEP_0114247082 /NCGR_PEP_ID=MMETSP0058-20121206/12829_1 /TAXON_ID=36894 /ORGANISM="Pyramimonas parkeae, CCMP726" /LENGTH=380 /DNA_ID=CAMNT_0001360357 /DNA_START=325 /DNA_END=1467 /DNA_ORIENTATION=+